MALCSAVGVKPPASAALTSCQRLPSGLSRRPFQPVRRVCDAARPIVSRAVDRSASKAQQRAQRSDVGPTVVEKLLSVAALTVPALAAQLLVTNEALAVAGGMAPSGASAPAAGEAAVGVAAAAQAQDPLVTGLFGLSIVALIVVTGGAAYLAITGILDERREKKDREAFSTSGFAQRLEQDKINRKGFGGGAKKAAGKVVKSAKKGKK
mmetsp:Transcript_17876/g.53807  ORF Transcript_17876/g.53807 Transcript_17876/m.53807 type:complete len:209 (+) Transcript_17876:177-803(+)